VDGGLVSSGDAGNTKYTFSKSIPDIYQIHVIAYDAVCGRSIEAYFYVPVGKLINLQGTISQAVSGIPIQNATVILSADLLGDNTTIFYSTTTDSNGFYNFTRLYAGDYNISIGAEGYVSYNESITLNYGIANTTTYVRDYTLTPERTSGEWTIQVIDYDTHIGIIGYNFTLYQGGIKVLEIRDGATIYKPYYNYFNTSYDGTYFETYIQNIPLGYTYTAKVDKIGYVGYPYLTSPAVISRTLTITTPTYLDAVHLKRYSTTTTTMTTTTTTTLPPCTGTESDSCYMYDGDSIGCTTHYVILFGG